MSFVYGRATNGVFRVQNKKDDFHAIIEVKFFAITMDIAFIIDFELNGKPIKR